jgi:hypothetical protein
MRLNGGMLRSERRSKKNTGKLYGERVERGSGNGPMQAVRPDDL